MYYLALHQALQDLMQGFLIKDIVNFLKIY